MITDLRQLLPFGANDLAILGLYLPSRGTFSRKPAAYDDGVTKIFMSIRFIALVL